MRMPETFDDLSDWLIEIDLGGGDRQAAAIRCEEWADQLAVAPMSDQVREITQADLLVAAAEQLRMLGRLERSVQLCERAIASGTPMRYDARAHLAAALFETGDPAQAKQVLARLRADRPASPQLHLFVGEYLEAGGDFDAALWWFTRGAMLAQRAESTMSAALLMIARRRVRQVVGFPPDEYDMIAADLTERLTQQSSAEQVDGVSVVRGGRRAPCSCGSGRKAKRCCAAADTGDRVVGLISRDDAAVVIDLVTV